MIEAMSRRSPGLSVARRLLWKIAVLCSIVGVVLVTVSVIVHQASGTRIDAIGFVGAALVYIAVAVWIAYAVVRMVGRERLAGESQR